MAFVDLVARAKNDPFGFQSYNNIKNNLDYLKAQSEIGIAEDGTAFSDDVIPAASLKASNDPRDGAVPTGRSAVTGGQTWEEPFENECFVFFS